MYVKIYSTELQWDVQAVQYLLRKLPVECGRMSRWVPKKLLDQPSYSEREWEEEGPISASDWARTSDISLLNTKLIAIARYTSTLLSPVWLLLHYQFVLPSKINRSLIYDYCAKLNKIIISVSCFIRTNNFVARNRNFFFLSKPFRS